MEEVAVHPTVIGAVFSFIFLLVSLGIGNLLYRVRKIEDQKVGVELLESKIQLIDTKIEAITDSMAEGKKRNQSEHETIFHVLEDIRDCVSKLANGKKEC
ncbi:MAG: hypothetical protein DSY80_00085 [Desulfocapsa sp.]|nr:MAG: hypothetical protein DSY80_00085 [Desulfocapsa sp.]